MPDMVHTVMPTDIHQPSPLRHHLLHRIARDARRALPHLARRAVSAMLRLSWQLDITVTIHVDVFTDYRADVAAQFGQYLAHPDLRMVADGPSLGPIGWRDIATASITDVRDMSIWPTSGPFADEPADFDVMWDACAVATLRITVAARDLDPDMYLDIEPDAPTTGIVRFLVADIDTVTRTPVRHR